MITIKNEVTENYEIKKSEFMSFLFPVKNADEIKIYLDAVRKEHKSATHVCYACILSKPQMEKCSDDGEPDGTAGKPLLELLKKRKLENVLLVVVRYFGGIKLGAGGLIRAYTHAGVLVCDRCEVVEIKEFRTLKLAAKLEDGKSVVSYLKNNNIEIENIIYSDIVTIFVKAEENQTKLINSLKNIKEIEYG